MQAIGMVVVMLSAMAVVASCAPARQAAPAPQGEPRSLPPPTRVLTASIPREPTFVAGLAPLPSQQASDFYQRMFNAFLDFYDDQSRPQPYLAEALPVLNTDSWVVFADGRMETRYRLKPNLVWHDGAPLTADDFVFSFQVALPSNGFRTGQVPYTLMQEVVAEDARSLVIRWKGVYPDANILPLGDVKFGLVPLPRHILEGAFNQGLEAFQGSLYWGHEFVGAGPFKLDRWERGSHLEAVAFDQHVLGRPKIDRIRLVFITDPNTAFANLLAGTTEVALDSISFAHMLQLRQEWGPANRGTAGVTLASLTAAYFQHRPEYANPRALLDLRVRKALAYGADRQTLAETVWAGELQPLHSIFSPSANYYPAIDRVVTKYPFDPRMSERLMAEAGYAKGADGAYAGPEGKLTFVLQAPHIRPEPPVLAANWRQSGFDVQEHSLSATEILDPQLSATFPSFYVNGSGSTEPQQMSLYRASEVRSAETRWRGENNHGWANPAFDRLVDAFNVTLDPDERVRQRAEMAKLMSEELPSIMLTPNPNMHAFLSTVKNVTAAPPPRTTGRITWNIERWELQ